LKQLGVLSGLGAANLLFGHDLKAAVSNLVQIEQGKDSALDAAKKIYRPLATGTVPKVFSQDQLDVLAELVELIIPATDTPGARAAGAHWYIDTVAEVDSKMGQQFMDGLTWLAENCREKHGKGFLSMTQEQQVEQLTAMSQRQAGDKGRQFFELVKSWTLNAYYKSEIGLLQELGWVGHEYLPSFPGCPHPDPSHRLKG
jgi:hypothetical protein